MADQDPPSAGIGGKAVQVAVSPYMRLQESRNASLIDMNTACEFPFSFPLLLKHLANKAQNNIAENQSNKQPTTQSTANTIKKTMPAMSRVGSVAVSPEILRRIPMATSPSPEVDSITVPPVTHCFSQGSFGYGSQCNLEAICSYKKPSPFMFISISPSFIKLRQKDDTKAILAQIKVR